MQTTERMPKYNEVILNYSYELLYIFNYITFFIFVY